MPKPSRKKQRLPPRPRLPPPPPPPPPLPPSSPPPLDDELTSRILSRCPAKSVGRFRCVSKRWLSLSTDPQFVVTHASLASVSGFFLPMNLPHREPRHFPLDPASPLPDPTLSFLDFNGKRPNIESSCHGLVLSHRARLYRDKSLVLSVSNPLTKASTTFYGPPDFGHICYLSLASLPPFFKVVAFGVGGPRGEQMFIYASETRSWKLLDSDLFKEFNDLCYTQRPVFWNGLLVWLGFRDSLVYMDVETEQLGRLPSPHYFRKCRYFGTSKGCLHFIGCPEGRGMDTHFDILEMEADCAKWSVLHRVDLDVIRDVYPEVAPVSTSRSRRKTAWKDPTLKFAFSTVCFMKGGGREVDRLLLSVPGKIVSYNLWNKSFELVCDNLPTEGIDLFNMSVFSWDDFFPHSATLVSLTQNQKSTRVEKNKAATVYEDRVIWTREYDKLLTSLMVEHTLSGNKWGAGFRKHAWLDMVTQFNTNTSRNYVVDDLKNRLRSYQQEYQIVRNMKSHKGFGWDHTLQMVIAGDAEWNEYIMVNPEAKLYRKQVPLFKDWEIICESSITKFQNASSSKTNDAEKINDNNDEGGFGTLNNLRETRETANDLIARPADVHVELPQGVQNASSSKFGDAEDDTDNDAAEVFSTSNNLMETQRTSNDLIVTPADEHVQLPQDVPATEGAPSSKTKGAEVNNTFDFGDGVGTSVNCVETQGTSDGLNVRLADAHVHLPQDTSAAKVVINHQALPSQPSRELTTNVKADPKMQLDNCLQELDLMEGVDNELYVKALFIFKEEYNQHIFLKTRGPRRLMWLRAVTKDVNLS